MRRFLLFLGSALLFLPTLAAAQIDYPVTVSPITYQRLPISDPNAGPVTNLVTTDEDLARRDVTLPFPFEFFGNTYTAMTITADGYVAFGSFETGYINAPLPSTTNPNNVIFVWQDDNRVLIADGHYIKTQVIGPPGNRQFIVEWKVKHYWNPFHMEMQLRLTENSQVIRAHYGPTTGSSTSSGSPVSSSMGIENSAGTIGFPGILPDGRNCNQTPPNTGADHGCLYTDFPSGYEIKYGATNEPDLTASVSLGTVTEENDGTQLRIPINVTVNNYGRAAAENVVWNYHFTQGATFNPTAPQIAPAHAPAETIAGLGSRSFTDIRLYPMQPVGEYRVCVQLDPEGVVGEVLTANNTACSTNHIVIGPDLVAESISFVGASSAFPGDIVTVRYRMKNIGTKPMARFVYDIKLADQQDSRRAQSVFQATHPGLAPGEVFEDTIQIRIPPSLSGERFFPYLHVNSDGKEAEATTRNNGIFGTTAVSMLLPDVNARAFVAAGECYFGRPLTVSYESCNIGQGTASNYVQSFFIHEPTVSSTVLTQMTLADATPEFCSSDADCDAMNQGVCVEATLGGTPTGTCHYGCVTSEDCGGGNLACLPDHDLGGQKSCQNVLVAGQCRTFQRGVEIPTVDYLNQPLLENHDYILTVLLDPIEKLNEGTSIERKLNNYARSAKVQCRYPAADLHAVSLMQPSRLAAGETIALHRKIENLGNEAASIGYRFVLTSNDIGSKADIQLPLVSTGGDGWVTLKPGETSERSDLVMVPSYIKAQEYYLALVIDPERTLPELDKTNNTIVVGKVYVEPSVLQVRNVVLPEGTLGQRYHHQLVATGGTDRYVWSAKNLPHFLSLSESGVLTAERLMDDGRFTFTVTVTSGPLSVDAPIVLEVGLPKGPLALDSHVLPTAYTHSNSPYFSPVSISGGVPPYECKFTGLPNRFRAHAEDSCAIVANVGLEIPGTHQFRVNVVDAKGTKVSGPLELSIIDGSKLTLTSITLFDGYIGETGYRGCARVLASNLGAPEEVVYTWAMDNAPAGLTADPTMKGPEGCLVGEPLECGSFMVKVRVESKLGEDGEMAEWAEAEAPLTVHCRTLSLESDPIPALFRGDDVDVQLRHTGSSATGATFRIYSGQLPDGLVLEPTGRLHGKIGDHVEYGSHTVIIEIDDGAGGRGLAGLAIIVQPRPLPKPDPRPKDTSSCSTAGGSPAAALPLGLLLLGLGLSSRRRAEDA